MRSTPALPTLTLCPGHETLLFAAPAGWTWRTRIGSYHNLWLVLDGQGTLRTRGQTLELRPGMGAVFAPGQEVEVTHDRRRPIRNFSAHFTTTPAAATGLPLLITHPALLPDLHPLALQALHAAANNDPLGLTQATHLVSAMLCIVLRDAGRERPTAHAAGLRLLGEQIRLRPEQPWSLAAVANQLGLSRAQASRAFSAHFGLSPGRFVIRCRIARATQMLHDTDLPIGTIAGLVGYADLFYFSRHFKTITGSAPSRLRGKIPGRRWP